MAILAGHLALFALLFANDVPSRPAAASADAIDQYRVKAAFLYNFAKFVEWPQEAFSAATEPISICVIGRNPFGTVLEETVAGKNVANRKFVVRNIPELREQEKCHILFIASLDPKHAHGFWERVQSRGILTVSDSGDATLAGGIIAFELKEDRIRIEIDPAAAQKARLRISSKLLSVADVKKASQGEK